MATRTTLPRRVVVKLGTQVVARDDGKGPDIRRLTVIVNDLMTLRAAGAEVLLVSSGAVGLGKQALDLKGRATLTDKQACAAVGQTLLMNTYQQILNPHGVTAAQILLTADDLSNQGHHMVIANTLEHLLRLGALPIINENDVVSTAGIRNNSQRSFDDNDKLSALVAAKLSADTLVILTNVDGVFTENPSSNPNAKILRQLSVDDMSVKTEGSSSLGRGGMTSKIAAARIASLCGVTTFISSGVRENPVVDPIHRRCGTCITPHKQLSKHKQLIGVSSGYSGAVVVDAQARKVLVANRSSLLPVGVIEVHGDFRAGEVVSIQDESSREIGRGIAEVSSAVMNRIARKRSAEARKQEPSMKTDEVIHRDHLVIFEEDTP